MRPVQRQRRKPTTYLISAVATEGGHYASDEYMEFLTANTDTPVPLKFCLPMDRIRQIAGDFIATGQKSERSAWEEI